MVQAKLVRKLPSVKVLSSKQIKTTIYVKSNTPYISALKRIKRFLRDLEKNGASHVVVLGMGRAIEKTLSLGCHFEQQLGKKVEVLTKTVELVDEVAAESDESIESEDLRDADRETTLKKRSVSGVELRVYP